MRIFQRHRFRFGVPTVLEEFGTEVHLSQEGGGELI